MTDYIPALIWALSAIACLVIARRRSVKKTALRTVLVTLLGPIAIPFVLAQPSTTEPVGHITGVGGIFFKAKEPKALAAWYRDVLGLPLQNWGGAVLRYDAPQHPPALIWNVLPESTNYFSPSTSGLMINYAVDDIDAFITRLKAKGVTPLKRTDDATGRFAWILDPEGNKIELWQPKPAAAP